MKTEKIEAIMSVENESMFYPSREGGVKVAMEAFKKCHLEHLGEEMDCSLIDSTDVTETQMFACKNSYCGQMNQWGEVNTIDYYDTEEDEENDIPSKTKIGVECFECGNDGILDTDFEVIDGYMVSI